MSEKRNRKLLHGLISSCDVGLAELTRDLQVLDPNLVPRLFPLPEERERKEPGNEVD